MLHALIYNANCLTLHLLLLNISISSCFSFEKFLNSVEFFNCFNLSYITQRERKRGERRRECGKNDVSVSANR